jgi:hypothetical protein
MAGPKQTPPGNRELRQRMRAAIDAGALAAPANPSGADPIFDGGEALATAEATAATKAGRPLRWQERREVRRSELERQASGQPAGQPQKRKQTLDDWLESLTPTQRANLELAPWFQTLSEERQEKILRRREVLEQVEADADYEYARWLEERALANIDHGEDLAVASEETIAAAGETEWSDGLTEAEQQAARDIAAATGGSLYSGDPEEVYSDDIEASYDLDDEEV